jgi:acetolactate synthase-1/2/3 large subunit
VRAADAAAVAGALDRLGLPVFLSGMARGLLGRDHRLHVRHRRREALRRADLVILAGVPCDFRLNYGRAMRSDCTVVAANRSRRDRRLNRRPTIEVAGDAGAFLVALAEATCGAGPDRGAWIEELGRHDAAREEEIEARSRAVPSAGVDPLALCRAVDAALPDEAVIVADGGDFVATASYIVRPHGPSCWLDPGPFGTLGVGGGFALGAARARPGAAVWILYGDGSAGYSIAEFDTFVRHGIPVVALVGNDACWAQIAREQVKRLGDDVGVRLARTEYERVAEGLGAVGLRIDRAEDVESVLRRALDLQRDGRAVLINATIAGTDFREGSISV